MAENQITFSSSSEFGSYGPSWNHTKTWDGNVSTQYTGPTSVGTYGDEVITYVLGATRRISRLRISGNTGTNVGDWMPMYSTDGVNFTIMPAVKSPQTSGWTSMTLGATDATHFRVMHAQWAATWRLYELELYYDDALDADFGNPAMVTGDNEVFPIAVLDPSTPFDATHKWTNVMQSDSTYRTAATQDWAIGEDTATFDLGVSMPISKWRWYHGINGTDRQLEYSDDDITYEVATALSAKPANDTEVAETFAEPIWGRYWRFSNVNALVGSSPRCNRIQWWVDGDTYLAGPSEGGGGGGAATVEYGDTLLKYLQDQGATSKEIVGALNELNATTGVEFDLAYRTYFGA